uniref:Integrase, catalytic region, zinc finger, CCHC-type, peptidase aspartic, catalytic n=1 Tax=Tanacetum cinerariifolium TaxID=118510 RepID=A0A6L2NIL4_TANCI|nr:hypothetical protein [Tanacetum cinerariifolium]
MNDLTRNKIILSNVTINTKFLNCLQPEWYKYVTSICLARNVRDKPYDELFNYLQQYEKLVIASRAKKLEKTHDPLALIAHTSSSFSRSPQPYYVTHPVSVVDYDDDYQGDTLQNDLEDTLTSAMMLLAHAITHRYFTPTNRQLRSSLNIRNQAVVQADRKETGNEQKNSSNFFIRKCYKCSVLQLQCKRRVILSSKQNDFLIADDALMEEIKELSANTFMMARIQKENTDFDEEPSYDFAFISEVQTPLTSFMNPLFSNSNHEQTYHEQPRIVNSTTGDDQINSDIIFDDPNVEVNNGSIEHDNNAYNLHDNELEQLAINAYKEDEKQHILAKKVKQQNVELTK